MYGIVEIFHLPTVFIFDKRIVSFPGKVLNYGIKSDDERFSSAPLSGYDQIPSGV
jgi:hypothetical protein